MAFHAKALEVFTLAYQSIQNVDEEEDLEVGRWRQGDRGVTLALQAIKVLFAGCDVSHHCLCLTSVSDLLIITHSLISHSPHPLTEEHRAILGRARCLQLSLQHCRSVRNYFREKKQLKQGGCCCRCPSILHASYHMCSFPFFLLSLNHLLSIHVEAKLLCETRLFFSESRNKAREIKSPEKAQ